MPWFELVLRTDRREWRRLEPALADLGALAVTLLDAGDEPILEPGPGETPLWRELSAAALFEPSVDRRGLIAALQLLVPTLDDARASFRDVADADWTRAWIDQYRPMRFGRRLWIYPSTVEPPPDDGAVVVRLDPGLAFGSGTHPSTALCLEWLDGAAARGALAGRRVIDFGCGSGVLAIAALKLGAARALGVDRDPQALTASADNARRNDVAAALALATPEAIPTGWAAVDLVLANILTPTLVALAPALAAMARPDATLVLAGLLESDVAEVAAAYGRWAEPLETASLDGWARLALRRC